MRIVHLANMYGPRSGGLRTTVNELSRRYAYEGHEVLVIVPDEQSKNFRNGNITFTTIKSPRIPLSGGYRIILKTRTIIELVEAFNPDVIELSDRTTMLKVASWAKSAGIPVYFFAHERVSGVIDAFASWLPRKKSLVRYWNSKTYHIVHRIIATTHMAASEFNELGIDSHEGHKISIIPLGVDLQRFKPVDEKTNRENYFLACTRLSKEKDPDFILDIASLMKKRNINLPIIIAGMGPLFRRMQKRIESEGLNVHLLGFIEDKIHLNQLMQNAICLLAPGPIETFGLAALECLASGTPVICRDSSAISEVISETSGCSLPRDPKAWFDQMLNFKEFDRGMLIEQARNRAMNFSWDKTAHDLIELYEMRVVA